MNTESPPNPHRLHATLPMALSSLALGGPENGYGADSFTGLKLRTTEEVRQSVVDLVQDHGDMLKAEVRNRAGQANHRVIVAGLSHDDALIDMLESSPEGHDFVETLFTATLSDGDRGIGY